MSIPEQPAAPVRSCPCCRFLRIIREAIKHPSVTSMIAAKRACERFQEPEQIVPLIQKCPIHGSTEALNAFWPQYEQLIAESNASLRSRVDRVFTRRGAALC